ncbi:MAG: penicillin-binding protein activator [Myxococcales bacterium]|jgi:branched-chain amino acid transport system substrate-binding protein
MYRSGSMFKSASMCVALLLLGSCAPKKVESPLEKAPPAEIVRARDLASNGEVRQAQDAYESFIIGHQGTVEADLARLELGILDTDLGRCERAVPHLEQAQGSADRALGLRASLHLATCQLKLGDPERALGTIEPLTAERFSPEEQALLWDDAIIASEQTIDAALALRVIDDLDAHDSTPPDPERRDATVDLLAQKITIEEALVLFDELRPGALPQVAVSMRLLRHALETQDATWVQRAADALRASPFASDPEVATLVAMADEFLFGNPYVVGALLPLSGRGQEVGRQLLQGMQLAQLDEGGPELAVEDTGDDPSKAAAAARSLMTNQRVVALLGPVGARTTEAAAELTDRAGIPLLSFSASEDVSRAGDRVFRFLYGPREELEALVGAARKRGLSRFVALYPDHGYGRTLERLFDQEVAAAGGVYCDGVAYPPGTKSFVEYVRTVLETSCDAVLLADVGEQIALIAPTFAAEGAWSTAGAIAGAHGERGIQFLLPSPSWSPTLLRRAYRYLQGALIALPFYESSDATLNQHFRTAYETRYGEPPATFAAYGYDAYRMVSAALRQGYQTRQSLADALMGGFGITSVTSVGSLSSDRSPAHPPQLYEVREELLQSVGP